MKWLLHQHFFSGRKTILLGLLSVFVCSTGNGQQLAERNAGEWMLGLGIAAGRLTVVDKSFSSQSYNGVNPGIFLAARYTRSNRRHLVEVNYQAGKLKTDASPQTLLKQNMLTVDYARLYPISFDDENAFSFHAGPGVNLLYAKRNFEDFLNNNGSFESAISISGVAEVQYNFGKGENGFFLSGQLILPVLCFVTQPVFGEGSATRSAATDKYISGFSSFKRVITRLSIEKNLSGGQRVALCYYWDYYQATRLREIRSAKHQLGLSYSLII